jgi:hypothetical protein
MVIINVSSIIRVKQQFGRTPWGDVRDFHGRHNAMGKESDFNVKLV